MIVDAHLHLFPHGYGRFPGPSPLGTRSDVEAYEALMAAHGIGGGLVVCYEAEGIDPANNAYVRGLAATRPWIASVAYVEAAANLDAAGAARLLNQGHVGIAMYLPDAAAASTLARWPQETWRLLSGRRAIVSLNARPAAIAAMQPTVDAAPGCQFLFSHLGLPGAQDGVPSKAEAAQLLRPLLDLAGRGNVGTKISGLYAVDPVPPHDRARPFIDLLFERFRPTDLHWGSDFSPALGFVTFEQALALAPLAKLPAADRRMVMGEGLAAKIRLAAEASASPTH